MFINNLGHITKMALMSKYSEKKKNAGPIKAKFYMKHLQEGGTNVFINNLGHMTKMAVMTKYIKNPSKIFFSRTGGPISTNLGTCM